MSQLVPVVLDFTKASTLNESFLTMFGATVEEILRRMFGHVPSIEELEQHLPLKGKRRLAEQGEPQEQDKYNVKIKGSEAEIKAFLGALIAEKKYIETYMNFGYDDERSREAKYELGDAIEHFETATGLLWPFK